MTRFAAALALLLVAGTALAAPGDALTGRALGDALRRGGYVLYFRHASTDFGESDEAMTNYDDCARQRNLTDKGRAEARAIGAGVARAHVPIGDVIASPFCRTRETARLAFARAAVSDDVRGGPAVPDDQHRYDALRARLATPVPAGTNVVIVSHGNPFRAVAGPPYLAEGEAAVVEPQGAKGFRIVGHVPRDGWDALAGR